MSRAGTRFVVLAVCLAASPAAFAQKADGPEFRAAFHTTGDQRAPDVAVDGTGSFLVSWKDACTDCFETTLYLGAAATEDVHIGSQLSGQTYVGPALTGLVPEGFIVAYAENPLNKVLFYRHNSAVFGTASTTTSYAKRAVDVAGDGAQNFVIVWESYGQDGSGSGIFARRFLANGAPREAAEFQVSTTTTGDQKAPAVASAADGSYMVVWQSGPLNNACCAQVFAQRYDAGGVPVGGEFQVSTNGATANYFPDVSADPAGNFVVAWTAYGQYAGVNYNVIARRFSPSGAPSGGFFRVNSATTGIAGRPKVGARSGDFVVAWDEIASDGSSYGVFARRYSTAGAPLGASYQVNTYTTGLQYAAHVAAQPGRYVIVWQSAGQDGDGMGIFGQKSCIPGDANGNGAVDVVDVFYLINALFAGGSQPNGCGNVNGDQSTDVADVFWLINSLFAGGPPPV